MPGWAPRGVSLYSVQTGIIAWSASRYHSCSVDLNVDAPMLRSSAQAARQFALVQNLDVGLVDRLVEVHGRIRAPTLLLWGEHDPIFPLAKARAMASQFAGGASLEVLPGGKTFVHEEQPDAFARWARPFLLRAFEQGGGRQA